MAWGKLDDKLYSHPKTMRLPRARRCEAIGLWTLANSWCNDHETDGHVPRDIPEDFGSSNEVAQLLVDARMWIAVDDGFLVANWDEYNFTAEQLQAKRDAETERKRKYREGKKPSTPRSEVVSEAVPPGPTSVPVGQERDDAPPVPEPVPKRKKDSCASTMHDTTPDPFETWWQLYPRKIAKAPARKAFTKALRKTDIETLVAAVLAYTKLVHGKEPEFIAHASTWLNAERWTDEDIAPATADSIREWVRTCWKNADTTSIENRTGLTFHAPDIPDHITDAAAYTADARRQWISDNHDTITTLLTQEDTAA